MLTEQFIECSRCGNCKEVCPSYRIFLNESFSPRGRLTVIKAFEENSLFVTESFKKRVFSCLICGACENLCPLNINVSQLIYDARAKMKKGVFLYLFRYFSFYPGLFFAILQSLNRLGFLRSFLNHLNIKFLNKFLSLDIPIRNNTLQVYTKLKPKARIAIFSGCSVNYLFPSIIDSLVYILGWLNYEVVLPKQHCCGAPLVSTGFKKEAQMTAKKNVEVYKSFNIDGVITPCPTCAHLIEYMYKEIIGENIKVLKISELFDRSTDVKDFSQAETVFFHVSCHSSNYIKEADDIISVLRASKMEIHKKTGCCGFAGVFSFLFEKHSMDILRKKVLEYEKADIIISSCPNCMIQLKSFMQNKKIFHYAEILNKMVKGEKNGRKIKL